MHIHHLAKYSFLAINLGTSPLILFFFFVFVLKKRILGTKASVIYVEVYFL